MERIKLIAVLAVAVLLSACGDVHSDINDMLEKNIDVSLVPSFARIVRKVEKKYFYVDYDGNRVVELDDVRDIAPFSCGLAYVKDGNGKNLFINKDGETVIDLSVFDKYARPVFDRFTNDVAFVTTFDACYAINPKGEVLFMVDGTPETPMESGYCLVRKGDGKVVINHKGEVVVDASEESGMRIEYMCGSRCDMLAVDVDGEYKLFDLTSGKFFPDILPEDWRDYRSGFDWNDRAVVYRRDNGRDCYGLMDRKGNIVVEPIYEKLVIDGQWYMADNDGCAMWIDADGKVMLETTYKFKKCIGFGTGNLCYVGNKIYIDRKGRWALLDGYEAETPFVNGRAIVRVPTGKDTFSYSWMDEKGGVSEQYFLLDRDFISYVKNMAKGIYHTLPHGY